VDFDMRKNFLDELKVKEKNNQQELLQEILQNFPFGRVKLYATYKALNARLNNFKLFSFGRYFPLKVSENMRHHVVAFIRKKEPQFYIVIVPKLVTNLIDVNEYPLGEKVWKDGYVELPDDVASEWKNVFTDEELRSDGKILLKDALSTFPVCLLLSKDSNNQ
jgi:(1->4)-alpha-D-glucan 1-alpha-D-glucosylmutase